MARQSTPSLLLTALALLAAPACDSASDGRAGFSTFGGPGVEIQVAPLTLNGVTEADYNIKIQNGSLDVVFDVNVSSSVYGNDRGSLAYVAPCDASDNDNIVTLTLIELRGGATDAVIPESEYNKPSAISKPVTCLQDGDVPVTFNLTIVRDASQGFFDLIIFFDDLFCSAKLDCKDDSGDEIELLFNEGVRDRTLVLGFACTGGVGVADTRLYMDDITITCDLDTAQVDPSAADGILPPEAISQTANILFGAAVYRGQELIPLANKAYWNIALGFEAGSNCVLTTFATVSDGPFDNRTTPLGQSYPVVAWNTAITAADNQTLVCDQHALSDVGGVRTIYLPNPKQFNHELNQ